MANSDAYQPLDLGSGGRDCHGPGGAGGGAVHLVVSEVFTLDGTLSADGVDGRQFGA